MRGGLMRVQGARAASGNRYSSGVEHLHSLGWMRRQNGWRQLGVRH